MNALPWLLVHGAAVWQVCLALFVLAGLAFASLRPRLAARRAARGARAALGPALVLPESHHAGAPVTLAGRLEAAEGPCLRYEDGSEAAAASGAGACTRAVRLVLRVGDAVVRLEGPVDVVVGSREAWPGCALGGLREAIRRRLEGEGAPRARSAGVPGVPIFRSLATGDRVRVSGVLGEEASDDAPSYRAAAKRWTLDGPLLAAFEGTPEVSGPAALVRVPPALAGGLLFLAMFGAGGEIAMSVASRELTRFQVSPDAERVRDARALRAVAIAAATPFRRADALGALARALDARRDADPTALDARETLHEWRGERAEAAAMWIEQGDPEHGAYLADREKRFALAARGWYAAGDFEHAAETWERAGAKGSEDELRFGAGVHLFAGRLDRAAHAARRLAASLRAHPADNERLRLWYAARAETADCLADALDARRGDADAWRRLHEPRPGPLPPACAVLRVDLFEGGERIRALEALPAIARDVHDVPIGWLDRLAAEADPRGRADPALPAGDQARVLLVPNEGDDALALPGVDSHVAERREEGAGHARALPAAQVDAMASAAIFALLTGNHERARSLAGRLRADADAHPRTLRPREHPRWARRYEAQALVAMITADASVVPWQGPTAATLPIVAFLRSRDTWPLSQLFAQRPPPDEDERQAWTLAAAGDGAGLARWLRRPWSQPGTFLRFGAPLLRTGRDEVARWVRWGHRPQSGFRPTDEVVHLANLAAAAAALDEHDTERRLRERAGRFREAILRRETAIPLAVLERL